MVERPALRAWWWAMQVVTVRMGPPEEMHQHTTIPHDFPPRHPVPPVSHHGVGGSAGDARSSDATEQRGAGDRGRRLLVAGGPISRVLSASVASRRRPRLIISLGRASPRASSGQPGDGSGPGKPFLPIGPCTGWGLPSCPCCHGHWCALTAPFHPYPRRSASRPVGVRRAERGVSGGAEDLRGRSALCCTCRRLTRPAVSWHPALRCPDFPQVLGACPRAPATRWPTLRPPGYHGALAGPRPPRRTRVGRRPPHPRLATGSTYWSR
jgi:hypothetical protein